MTKRILTMTRRLRADDGGYTLTEFIVAMGLFAMFLAMFGSGVVIMSKDTVRTRLTIDTDNEGRRAYANLDKQVRNAAAVNPVVLKGGTRYYVEFRTDTTGANAGVKNPALCTQWRLDTGTDRLQVRTWTENQPSTLTGWTTRARGITNAPGTPPFTFVPAGASSTKQRLDINWQMDPGPNAPAQRVEGSFVARNSSISTVTNTATATTNRICTDQGQP